MVLADSAYKGFAPALADYFMKAQTLQDSGVKPANHRRNIVPLDDGFQGIDNIASLVNSSPTVYNPNPTPTMGYSGGCCYN